MQSRSAKSLFSVVYRQRTLFSPCRRWISTLDSLSDSEILVKISTKEVSIHKLESLLTDPVRALTIRRQFYFNEDTATKCKDIPSNKWDSTSFFTRVTVTIGFGYYMQGHNCESVIGYVPIPVGLVGPILVNSKLYHIPMATTEGALIASTNRGARAIRMSGGVTAVVIEDGMTRAPVFKCESVTQAAEVKRFLETKEGFELVRCAFGQTTKHGKMEVTTR